MRIGGIYNPYEYAWQISWAGQPGTTGRTFGEHEAAAQQIAMPGASQSGNVDPVRGVERVPGDEDSRKKVGRKSSPEECQTCKERKYQDGSDENVSFKSAQHISPGSAGARVRAHEGEHVSNAYNKAEEEGGKVIQASVSIHTAICPECGRTYVSGGTTHTQIKYPNENNPYEKDRKAMHGMGLRGANIDLAV